MDSKEFAELLSAVRAGDQAAADRLVRHYEPFIRRVARLRLRNSLLRRILDSLDICQSIMATFLRRAQTGQFTLDTPEQLARLLAKMAINKVITEGRKNHKDIGGLPTGWDAAAPDSSPLDHALGRDLVTVARNRLTDDEYRLFEANKIHERSWDDIANELGSNADALRMRLTRALTRLKRELDEKGACHDE